MKLATWHESSGLTVADAATLFQVHRVTYHRYLSGRRMPAHAVVLRIEAGTDGQVTWADLARACGEAGGLAESLNALAEQSEGSQG